MKPVMLEEAEEISEEEAKGKVKQILENVDKDVKIKEIKSNGESKGKIDVYSFTAKYKDKDYDVDIDISKKGGNLVLLLADRKVKEKKIDDEKAQNLGIEFLKKIGIENMKATYYIIAGNMITINYAAFQDNLTLYPDLIKVKLAMDTGEVCCVETSGYLFNHRQRENVSPKISIDKAREVLAPNTEVLSESVAIIPTESKSEVLTYEFKGKVNGKEFLIYVNSQTGEQQKVLLIINTPNGTLTM